MERYTNTILNKQGKPVAGAVVTVTTYPGNEPATIYAADGGPAVQSVTSDDTGRFSFYAADGHYNLSITGRGIGTITVTDVLLFDPAAGFDPDAVDARITANANDLAATKARVTQVEADAAAVANDLSATNTRVGAAESDIQALQLGAAGVSWDAAAFPVYAAHRGMEMSFPENTTLAFQEAVKAGAGAVEMDCYLMADGSVAVMHDSNTARTCRLPNGTSISMEIETLTAQDLYGLDASYKTPEGTAGFFGSDFENNPPPLLQDVLATLKGKAIMLVEAKGTTDAKRISCAQAIADLVDKLKLQSSVVIQSGLVLPSVGVNLRGCKWGIIKTAAQMTDSELASLAADGCYTIIMDKTGIDAAYKSRVNAAGMKLCGYTYARPDQVSTVPDVVLCVDTTIVSGKRLAGPRDYLMRKYAGPGYTREGFGGSPGNSVALPVIRTIANRRAIGWPAAASPAGAISRTVICCIDPDPNNDGQYTLDFDVIWTVFDASMTSFCLVSVELDKAGTLAENAATSITKRGYSIGFRASGAAAIYRYAGDTPVATNIASATGLPNPPVLNQPYPCRIVVSSTGITATFDVGGLNIVMSSTDTTHRGGKYIQLERRGHGFMIANLRAS